MTTMHYLAVGIVSVAIGGIALAGCAVEPADSEEVGEAPSALGESTCATTTADATDPTSSWSCGNDSQWWASPTTTYGHSDCANGWVAEFSNVGNSKPSYAQFEVLGLTSTNCSSAHVAGYTYSTNDGSTWGSVGPVYLHGSWNGSSCDLVYDTGSSAPSVTGSVKSRIVAYAYTKACINCSVVRQRVGVRLHINAC